MYRYYLHMYIYIDTYRDHHRLGAKGGTTRHWAIYTCVCINNH